MAINDLSRRVKGPIAGEGLLGSGAPRLDGGPLRGHAPSYENPMYAPGCYWFDATAADCILKWGAKLLSSNDSVRTILCGARHPRMFG